MVRPGGHLVRSGSLSSVGCTLGVVAFVRGRWVHWGAPWRSPQSFWFVVLIVVPRGRLRVR